MLLLDLDHFKELNETVGFVAGDAVLRAVALRLVELRGPTDVVARLGDDDFAFLLSNFRQDVDVQRVANGLLQALRKPLDFGGHEIFATASLGVSLYPWDGEDAQTLLRNAEKALHTAKRQGRSRVQLYAATLGTADFETLELKTSLRHWWRRASSRSSISPRSSAPRGPFAGWRLSSTGTTRREGSSDRGSSSSWPRPSG